MKKAEEVISEKLLGKELPVVLQVLNFLGANNPIVKWATLNMDDRGYRVQLWKANQKPVVAIFMRGKRFVGWKAETRSWVRTLNKYLKIHGGTVTEQGERAA